MGILSKKKKVDEPREKMIEEARRLLEEEEELQRTKQEDMADTPIMETTPKTDMQGQKTPQEAEIELPPWAKENIAYYQERYMGMYMPQDFTTPGTVQCNLLFGILAELRAIKEEIKK